MKFIVKKRTGSSSKNTTEEVRTEERDNDGGDMEVVEVPEGNMVDTVSFINGINVYFSIFKASNYHQAILFLRVKQIKDADLPLLDGSLSHVNSLLPLFCMYGVDYYRGTILVMFHSVVITEDVTMLLIDGVKAGHKILNNIAKILFLDGSHHLDAI